jgi:hypothetical protein
MNRFRAHLSAVRSSYWFVPGVMALLGILLGALMIWVDAHLGTSWIEGLGWYQQIRSDGAREVLSTIAGSMVTVAGVVFSITIVAPPSTCFGSLARSLPLVGVPTRSTSFAPRRAALPNLRPSSLTDLMTEQCRSAQRRCRACFQTASGTSMPGRLTG